MRQPVRRLFERIGLVRRPGETEERYREADRAAEEGYRTVDDARRRRQRLAIEVRSYHRRDK